MSNLDDKLRESKLKHFNFVNNLLDILLELRLDLTIIYINPYVYDILGYSPEELVGKNYIDILHPDDELRITEMIDRSLKTHEIISTELNLQHKKGYYVSVSARGRFSI